MAGRMKGYIWCQEMGEWVVCIPGGKFERWETLAGRWKTRYVSYIPYFMVTSSCCFCVSTLVFGKLTDSIEVREKNKSKTNRTDNT